MSDIVERLRQIAATKPGEQSLWDCTVAAWAADEIERLYIALRKISDLSPSFLVGSDKWGEVAMRMGKIADDALADEQDVNK